MCWMCVREKFNESGTVEGKIKFPLWDTEGKKVHVEPWIDVVKFEMIKNCTNDSRQFEERHLH